MCEWGKYHNSNYKYDDCRLENVRVLLISNASDSLGVVLKKYGAIVSISSVETVSDEFLADVLLVDLALLNSENSQILMSKVNSLAMIAIVPINNSGERGRAYKMGFVVHISSPVDSGELIATLASLVGRIS